MDVQLSDEVFAIECAYGNDGFAVIVKAWMALYHSDSASIDCSAALQRIPLAKRANVSDDRWTEIIGACVEVGLFDKDSWKNGMVLTSSGVNKRIARVQEERDAARNRAEKRWPKAPDKGDQERGDGSSPNNPETLHRFSPKNDARNDAENNAGNNASNDAGNDAQSDAMENEKESKRKEKKREDVDRGKGESAERGKSGPPKARPLSNPGFSQDFMDRAWPFFLKCKVGKPYKNRESQEVALRQLYQKCNGDEEEAKAAFQYTIFNNWSGLSWYFERKQNHNGSACAAEKQAERSKHAAAFDELLEAACEAESSQGTALVCTGRDPDCEGEDVLAGDRCHALQIAS